MNKILDAALAYAARGWRVFPVHTIFGGRCTCGRGDCGSLGKHPLVRRGVHEATTEPRVIKEWWRRWRRANIGIATGSASGIVVIDVDLPAALGSLHILTNRVPRTLTSLTGGGGLHLLFRPGEVGPPAATSPREEGEATPFITRVTGERIHDHTRSGAVRLRNRAGGLPGIDADLPGIDLRADGGYILAPPSAHISGARYEWLDIEVAIADAPEWLREPHRAMRPPTPPHPPRFTDGIGTPYGRAALEGEISRLRAARVGERNCTLYRVACRLFDLACGGYLDHFGVYTELHHTAVAIGLTEWETTRTLYSATQPLGP